MHRNGRRLFMARRLHTRRRESDAHNHDGSAGARRRGSRSGKGPGGAPRGIFLLSRCRSKDRQLALLVAQREAWRGLSRSRLRRRIRWLGDNEALGGRGARDARAVDGMRIPATASWPAAT
jgi:hypothetical protein